MAAQSSNERLRWKVRNKNERSIRNDKSIEIKKPEIEEMGVLAARYFKKGEIVYSFKKGKMVGIFDIQDIPESEKRYLDKIGENEF